ncbi:MAG: DUF3857 domain-containing transglutaminase family protein [Gammaproteobacteria bacterium]|jgi:hypothetical protein
MKFPSVTALLVTLVVCINPATVLSQPREIRSGEYSYTLGPVPSWVNTRHVKAGKPDSHSNGPVNYLLIDKQVRLREQPEKFFHVATQPVTLAGVETLSKLQINFNPAYQKLTLHFVRVHRSGKKIDKLPSADFKLIQQEKEIDMHLYNGTVTALGILSDIRVGDVVEYAYTVQGSNPVFGKKYIDGFALGWTIPVSQVYVRLLSPPDRKLYFKTFNIELEPVQHKYQGMKERVWSLQNTQAIEDEGEYPQWYDPYPWLQASEYKSWHEVEQWTASLYDRGHHLNNALTKLTRQWKNQYNNKTLQQVAAALNFVQDEIRYFGVEYASNSHMPSAPNTVYERRFGDCKDKTLLLVSLLENMGVKAYPALVSTRYGKGVEDWLPTPAAFDHVIVKAVVNNESYWLDPTSVQQSAFIDSIGAPRYGRSLVVDGAGQGLDKIPLDKDDVSHVEVTENYQIAGYEGSADLEVSAIYTGRMAEWQRQKIRNSTKEKLTKAYLNYYEKFYTGIRSVGDATIEDDMHNNVLKMKMHYSINQYFKEDGDWLQYEVYPYMIKSYVALPKVIQRKMPLSIYYPIEVNHRIKIKFPPNAKVAVSSGDLTLDDEHIKYSRHIDYSNHNLLVDYAYSSKKDAVTPPHVADHVTLLKDITDSLSLVGSIRNIDKVTKRKQKSNEMVNKLLNRLP